MTFSDLADRLDYTCGQVWFFFVFNAAIIAFFWLAGVDVANVFISIFTADVLLLTAGANRRANKATQAKLDELIRAVDGARDGLAHVEDMAEAEIDKLRR